jgi:protoporphyrinogen oxidase
MGKGLVTAILSENGSRNLFNKSDDIIKQEALREIDLLFSDFSKKVIFSKVYRWEYGAIQLKPGILYQQGLTRKALEDRFRNLFFVSDSLNRSSIEVQIRAGIKVAMQIIQR